MLPFTAQPDHFAGSGMFRYIIATMTGTDDLKHFIHILVSQRFIHLQWYVFRLHEGSHRRQPLKIGIMGNEYNDTSMFFEHGKIFFSITILHTTGKVFERHTHHLYFFQHIVADIAIKLTLNLAQFSLGFFRKRILQILTNYLTTIMHHMTHQKTNSIGQYIKCPKRKQSQKPHASVSQPVDKFRFHTFLIPYYNSTIPCNAVPSSLKSPKRTGTT